MRRKERGVEDVAELEEIIIACKDCTMGMIDETGFPYVIPLNFGFEKVHEHFIFYFHSALAGKKITCLQKNPQVCLTFVSQNQVVSRDATVACTYTTKYASVIARGSAEIITDLSEKTKGLNLLMKHQTGKTDFTYQDQMLEKVAVIKVSLTEISGKSSL